MAYRNKVFISFDGDKDIHYYRLMKAWKQNDNTDFNFSDAHDLNYSRDSSLELSIKSQLSERLHNTRVFVSLVGESTKFLYKFVRWEIEQAIRLQLPIIVVNLNGERSNDLERCPPLLLGELSVHIGFGSKILGYALENWPTEVASLRKQGKTGPFHYVDDVYKKLGQ
jgi:hypothetical protein